MKIKWKNNMEKILKWHIWFAWYPIKINTSTEYNIVWLEKVLRKGIHFDSYESETGISDFIAYEYKSYNNIDKMINKKFNGFCETIAFIMLGLAVLGFFIWVMSI